MKVIRITTTLLATLAMVLGAGCQQATETAAPHGHDHHGADHHGAEDDYPRGPHGGRLLSDGEFAVEMTIDESGRPPRWQVYLYRNDQQLKPESAAVNITLERLGGRLDRFRLRPEGQALVSDEIVTEPHSFLVEVEAQSAGAHHHWRYESFEGRVTIPAAMAGSMGIAVEPAGPADYVEQLSVLGRVAFAPDALARLRAQFPGRVVKVLKTQGDEVSAGETLAMIEASDSLRQYPLRAPFAGVVIERDTNVGDVVRDNALFVIGDLRRLRINCHIYPGYFSRVRPGQTISIESIDGEQSAVATINAFLPTTESATQTIIAYADLPNPDQRWLPGMTVSGQIEVAVETLPLAVRTRALQRFRDFTVVFARIDDTYEVRMLELGRQNEMWTEVLGGIVAGQDYVVDNSFLIKADIEKAGASHDH